MGFSEDIRRVLEIEREGKKRLAAAQDEARRILDGAREESRRILEEGEQELASRREKRAEAELAETAGEVQAMERRFREESERLSHLAQRNREAAGGRIVAWLWGEE